MLGVILQILLWILRIILFLLVLLVLVLGIIIIVPIRYQVSGEVVDKQPKLRGKVTWFFYLIYMKFVYENEFCMQVKVFGISVFDTYKETKKEKNKSKDKKHNIVEPAKESEENFQNKEVMDSEKEYDNTNITGNVESATKPQKESSCRDKIEDELEAWEKEVEKEAKEEAELASKLLKNNKHANNSTNTKISFSEKIENIKAKLMDIVEKIKYFLHKIQEGKLKLEHYLELWNKKETQVTFSRAKEKFRKIIKVILPRKWKVTGNVGFEDPATTGQMMGILGAMYPLVRENIFIIPEFDEIVFSLRGDAKGYVRLGNLIYQLITLLLNKHCFKFIKLVLDELGGSKKSKEES